MRGVFFSPVQLHLLCISRGSSKLPFPKDISHVIAVVSIWQVTWLGLACPSLPVIDVSLARLTRAGSIYDPTYESVQVIMTHLRLNRLELPHVFRFVTRLRSYWYLGKPQHMMHDMMHDTHIPSSIG
jgi:hypothetical protein